MTASDQDYSADERFERLLVDSAQSDELPSNVDAAWNKFGAALNGSESARRRRWRRIGRASRAALAFRQWLIWGVLAGSTLTALSLRLGHDRGAGANAAPSAAIALPTATSSASTAGIELETQPQAAPRATVTTKPRAIRPARPSTLRSRGEDPPSPSTLSAQVAMLDAARSAIAAGAFAEALRLADRYRSDFPNGELAPEAEVVAIEALVEQEERQPAAQRAARFFARYPGDPHTARVKWLVR